MNFLRNLKNSLLFILVIYGAIFPLQAQWRLTHPGGGGQIQHVELDPLNEGRLYVCSDVEGAYRSDNFGDSYQFITEDIPHGMIFTIEADPNVPNRIYMGTIKGVYISDDAGDTWRGVAGTINGTDKGLPVANIKVDPTNSNNIYFANSWLIKHTLYVWNENKFNREEDIEHTGQIWVSRDNGDTWNTFTFEPEVGYMNVYSIHIDPNDNSVIYVSAHSGIYRSKNFGQTWQKLNKPQGAFYSRGIDITPDGKWMYGAFTNESNPEYFGVNGNGGNGPNPDADLWVANIENTTTTNYNWLHRGNGLTHSNNGRSDGDRFAPEYWLPKVNPRSTGNSHEVIMGTLNGAHGLWTATFQASGSSLSTPTWERILWTSGRRGWDYEQGWDFYNITSRLNYWTPTSWSQERIWANGNQNLFLGNPFASDWPKGPNSWTERYSKPHKGPVAGTNGQQGFPGGFPAYEARGNWASTVTMDVDGDQNYMIQAHADNGILESYDGGYSWSRHHVPSGLNNGRAVLIVKDKNPRVVLASAGGGFGSANGNGNIYLMEMTTSTTADQWSAPVPFPVSSIVEDLGIAANNDYVFAATRDAGIWVHNDLDQLVDGQGGWELIKPGEKNIRVIPHPSNSNIVYVGGKEGFCKGVRTGNGFGQNSWTWTVLAGGTGIRQAHVWEHSGQTYVAYIKHSNTIEAFLSDNGGDSFVKIFDQGDTFDQPWEVYINGWKRKVGNAIFGFDDNLYISCSNPQYRKDFGFYKTKITSGTTLSSWEDISKINGGQITLAYLNMIRKVNLMGEDHLAVASHGSGAYVWPLDGTHPNRPPSEPFALSPGSTPIVAVTSINLNASDLSLEIGENSQLAATVLPGNATNKSVTYTSTDSEVATVNNAGLVSAISPGQTTIRATTSNGLTDEVDIEVTGTSNGNEKFRFLRIKAITPVALASNIVEINWLENNASFPSSKLTNATKSLATATVDGNDAWRAYDGTPNPWGIALNYPATLTLDLGSDGPINPTGIKIKANATNRGIASFELYGSNDGVTFTLIHAVSGLTSADYPNKEATILFDGSPSTVSVSDVSLSIASSTIDMGATTVLTSQVIPVNASNQAVIYTSSDENIAQVNAAGIVTGVSNGTTTLTVTTVDSQLMDQVQIQVVGSSSTSYRYLRLVGKSTVELSTTIVQINWLHDGGNSPSVTSATKNLVTATVDNGNAWKAYDNAPGGWKPQLTFPASITIDLGDGNEITPTGIELISNATNRAFGSFDCLASNDGTNFTLLHSENGLTDADYPGKIGVFTFTNALRKGERQYLSPNEISLYPNPTSTSVHLKGANEFDKVVITDFAGKTVNISPVWSKGHLSLDLMNIPSGIYFIKITNRQQIFKIMKH